MDANNLVDVTIEDDKCTVRDSGAFSPIVAEVNGDVCTVYVAVPNGKPIATVKVVNKDTGEAIPVNVSTCTEAVVCSEGKTMQQHLGVLYGHANDHTIHLTGVEKDLLETKVGAQQKADTAKREAISSASVLVDNAKATASADATQKASAAQNAANRYTDTVTATHTQNKSNPHGVTAAQVGLGNVPNKSTNDQQPTYTEASTLTSLSSGEKLSIAFGKIAKAITDFIAHIANKGNPHGVTAAQAGALPKTGGTLTGPLTLEGPLILQENVHYFDVPPEPGIPGRIVFVKVAEE